MKGKHPFALMSAGLGLGGSIVDDVLRQTGKFLFAVDHNLESIVGCQQVLVELEVKVGKSGVNFLQFGLLA